QIVAAAGGNLKISAGTNVPVNGGLVTINGIPQAYRGFHASATTHVKGAQTISSGGDLTVESVYAMPDQGSATIDGVACSWASVTSTGGSGSDKKLVNVTFSGGAHAFP